MDIIFFLNTYFGVDSLKFSVTLVKLNRYPFKMEAGCLFKKQFLKVCLQKFVDS